MSDAEPDEMTSLANLVLDTVERLRRQVETEAPARGSEALTLREISFSIAYDPGADRAASPLRHLPWPKRGQLISWAQARTVLLAQDRPVILEVSRLGHRPRARLARLDVTFRL